MKTLLLGFLLIGASANAAQSTQSKPEQADDLRGYWVAYTVETEDGVEDLEETGEKMLLRFEKTRLRYWVDGEEVPEWGQGTIKFWRTGKAKGFDWTPGGAYFSTLKCGYDVEGDTLVLFFSPRSMALPSDVKSARPVGPQFVVRLKREVL